MLRNALMVVRIRNLTGIARLDVDFGASSILDSYLPVGEISCAHAPSIVKNDPITQMWLQPTVNPLRSKGEATNGTRSVEFV